MNNKMLITKLEELDLELHQNWDPASPVKQNKNFVGMDIFNAAMEGRVAGGQKNLTDSGISNPNPICVQ